MTNGRASTPSLHQFDAELDRLKAAYPGWNIWYVPRVIGHTVWCAQPLPLINTDSPEHLAQEIEDANADREAVILARDSRLK
jgi:hypothetical protein